MSKPRPAWLTIASRCAAGLLGGYAFTYAITAFLARVLPMAATDAVIVATLPAFVFYTLAVLWAFACRSERRAWALAGISGPLALVAFWPQLWSN
ncbi:iron transporter [Pseudomonas alkylphenolica]|uniref:iron transporter n=1 Tax=Pseudomonas alkylphenolica TaxID=237609 RepID=UPI0018D96C7A|nr:iron transporter [Pseudomonas alkylphenolica]MBH3428334.1 iron transporter [Pseudomonas alkylphenolica]